MLILLFWLEFINQVLEYCRTTVLPVNFQAEFIAKIGQFLWNYWHEISLSERPIRKNSIALKQQRGVHLGEVLFKLTLCSL